MDTSTKPFIVHSDTKITLGRDALEMAKFNNMSVTELARHLLEQHRLKQAGLVQRDGEQ